MSKKYLKSLKTNRVFMHTPELETRSDMVACDVNGNVSQGETGEIVTKSQKVRESKYIGLMVNGKPGRLMFYSDQLALKPGVVSIDDPSEWSGDISNVVPADKPAEKQKPVEQDSSEQVDVVPDSSPALSRETDVSGPVSDQVDSTDTEQEDQVDQPAEEDAGADTDSGLSVPDVSSIMDEKEKKSILCKFAFDQFGAQMSRKFGVPRMIEECQALINAGKSPV